MTGKKIQHIGYIGLGIMGTPMAINLLQAGFRVTVWNRTASKCRSLKDAGAGVADSPRELARSGPDAICINVTDTPDVESVLFGNQGVAEGAQPGLIVIDHSTISPQATQRFSEQLAEQDVTLLDAPVSGGDVGARRGTLSIMVGGPKEAFDQCLTVFEAVGERITHVGGPGMGQVCKACNQIAVSCTLMGVCEAMALASKSGLSLKKMVEVVAAGAGGSWQLANLGPKIAAGDDQPGFMIDLVLKDLAIVAKSAEAQHLTLSGTEVARRYFQRAADQGHGRSGTQAMARAIERINGFTYPSAESPAGEGSGGMDGQAAV